MDNEVTSYQPNRDRIAKIGAAAPVLEDPRFPLFRRQVFPSKLVLSATDLQSLAALLSEINIRARELELNGYTSEKSENRDEVRGRIQDSMKIFYSYTRANGDLVEGLYSGLGTEIDLPDDVQAFFFIKQHILCSINQSRPS